MYREGTRKESKKGKIVKTVWQRKRKKMRQKKNEQKNKWVGKINTQSKNTKKYFSG